ncbi:ribokinase [Pragia fontium]|uniref:Ribokinase n=1 Tax=Pragia fontium DSM 5563 = ATCC 49100 TaxID=1122977 RepID=A0AAJ4WDQ8_9GAMM|nr:ribokinase [Pragia fontium]AKJ43393.1 ribokinase [Pragia fontium]SFD47719.1 ribokinase [Pragia fontium DSM 5563 = ATCC 49100]SUB83867.1 Ribokinase [Pragia fontium]VEJ56772.1 Ribokinase [Pragia fontium]
MSSNKLVVLGSINADHILNVNEFPRPGETITGKDYRISFGGKGANQAVAAGRSGANITFIACVGDDDIGQQVCRQLAKDNIDIHPIERVADNHTGVAMIFVNGKGENMIAIDAGANAAVTPDYLEKYRQQVITADALLMQLETPLETIIAAAQLAKQHNTLVALNPAPARELPDELLTNIDIITPNETEAEQLTGVAIVNNDDADRAAAVLHARGIGTVIITLGSRGAWVSIDGIGRLIEGYTVEPVDTIAAGDTFNGALITAMLEGQELSQAVRFAHAAAAIAVTRRGAQPSVPWRKEIDEFLAIR